MTNLIFFAVKSTNQTLVCQTCVRAFRSLCHRLLDYDGYRFSLDMVTDPAFFNSDIGRIESTLVFRGSDEKPYEHPDLGSRAAIMIYLEGQRQFRGQMLTPEEQQAALRLGERLRTARKPIHLNPDERRTKL